MDDKFGGNRTSPGPFPAQATARVTEPPSIAAVPSDPRSLNDREVGALLNSEKPALIRAKQNPHHVRS